MKDQHRNELKVGLTVIIGFTLLLGGFTLFKGWNLGGSQHLIFMQFPTSAGLQIGDQVFVNGVKAGRIASVDLKGHTVLVSAMLEKEYEISSDAKATIQMLELMGGKKVEIIQGMSPVLLLKDQVLKGSVDPDISGALGMVGHANVEELAANANTLLMNSNKIIGDTALFLALKDIVMNLRTVSKDLKPLVRDSRANITDLVSTLTVVSHSVDTMLQTLGPQVHGRLDDAGRMMKDADSLLASLQGFVTEIRNNKGLVSRLMNDTTLAGRVDGLLFRLDSLSNMIVQGNLKVKIRIF